MKTVFHSSIAALCLLVGTVAFSQQADSTKTKNLEEVMVQAVRANEKTPVTFSNFGKKEIAKRNLGQDIPVLMNFLPSVVTTSDAGNGVGYTGIRVRGSDATRVNVTINGIPYNDSESHGTFWVNMPDFASSAESIQLQRGVGTSTNGAGAFGASLNVLTEATSARAGGEISNSYGSFNTHKHTVKFNTGIMNDQFEISGRLSKINSDGYIDRASSNLKSYFLQGSYLGKTTKIKALVFGGKEITYQSWNGLEDPEKLKNDRTFNTAGMYTDEFGNTRFYDNEVDNYQQDHYQLHWNETISENWNTNLAFHYTKGKGFYENYKEDADFTEYNMTPAGPGTTTDLIRQKWLDNDFYGTTFSANYTNDKLAVILGGGANKYEGLHFGKVIWARYASTSELGDHYYDDFGIKTDLNFFAKANYQVLKQLNVFGDLQFRKVNYKANGLQPDFVNETFDFFNPKAGLTFSPNQNNNIYFSYARANREPKREDFENSNVKPEKLNDFELGWRFANAKAKLNINAYYMLYKDQLVLTGALNDVGTPIAENSGKSYRIGLEVDAKFLLSNQWSIQPNVAISRSRNQDFYFQRDGVLQNLGETNVSFSPEIIAGNILTFSPLKPLQISLLSKFIGEQFMGNIDAESSKLDSYFINDLNITYEIETKKVFKSIVISVLANNILNKEYISNGYFYTYDDTWSNPPAVTTIEGAGYYPQAGANILAGLTLKF
ncbi:TonB-dependent receptor [Flavobacterium humi]|uniref:TonB-dependent receptor n=1 Tax=Flavobacterium humi TaxID=2562683 RepID=A0A4Z0L762_9FLAO|nr:TonB-dependent receptor [Flavobacterium humi]TGD57619.1 TonB-dependent receptor [Flavobacterium humi]